MKYVYLILVLLGTVQMIHAANVTCNERMRHGRVGTVKLGAAVIGGFALWHMMKELRDTSEPLRTGRPKIVIRQPSTSLKQTCLTGIALGVLAWETYRIASDSVSSLAIFFEDNEELDSPFEEIIEEESTLD